MIEQARFAAITDKTKEVLDRARRLYGVSLNPTIAYNLRGRVAGWAGCKICRMTMTRQYTLRFNRDLILGKHFEDIRDETVAHEVAHLVCFANPALGKNHNEGWKRVCLALGGNGKSRHSYDVEYAAGTFVYVSDRGVNINVSKIRHTKIQQGTCYTFKGGKGRVDRYCAWAAAGQTPRVTNKRPEPLAVTNRLPPGGAFVPPPGAFEAMLDAMRNRSKILAAEKPAALPRRSLGAGMSKADQVRAWIREAKNDGHNQGWVVQLAMSSLDMPRGQAIRYVTENWEKV